MIRPIFRLSVCLLGCAIAAMWVWPSAAETTDAPNTDATNVEAKTPNPAPVFDADVPRLDPVDAPEPEKLDAAIQRGIDFLLKRQNPKGSWGSARRTKGLNIYAPVPGSHHAFRTGVTSLCVSALIQSDDQRDEVKTAIDSGEQWLLNRLPKLRRADSCALYNNWGHIYAVRALTDLYRRSEGDEEKQGQLRELLEQQIGMLSRYECLDGGWCYYDSWSGGTKRPSGSTIGFVTAAGLVSLADAKSIGISIPDKMVRRAKKSLVRQRLPDFSYAYGEYFKYYPAHPINRPGGSLGRSQVCNLAMYLWEDEKTTVPVMRTWLDRLFARNGWLSMGRKRPIPHESWCAVAGYFYYYGHYYAAQCIELLPEEERPYYHNHMAATLLPLQEKNGCWWDFPLYDYHQQYGTAMALMSLYPCREPVEKK